MNHVYDAADEPTQVCADCHVYRPKTQRYCPHCGGNSVDEEAQLNNVSEANHAFIAARCADRESVSEILSVVSRLERAAELLRDFDESRDGRKKNLAEIHLLAAVEQVHTLPYR